MIPCKYCEIFKKSFFYRTPPVANSDISYFLVCSKRLDFVDIYTTIILTPDLKIGWWWYEQHYKKKEMNR